MQYFELWINNTLVDLKDSFPLSLNASIADIAQPDTRQTTYSKTITIPASKSNRDLFNDIFQLDSYIQTSGTVNYVPDFNPNLKASAIAYVDSVEVFNGIAQLLQINVTDNEDIEFEIVLTGQLVNLFKNIGDKELTDLDFSLLDHDYTLAEIEASWSNTEGYVYPLIDYGRSQNTTDFPLEGLYPAIFVKDYIDRIFDDAGCTYDSDFFNTDFFGNLIVPFNGADFKMSSDDITDRKFRAERTTDQQVTVTETSTNTTVVFNDESTPPNFDNSGNYNNANGTFTVGTGLQGTYNFGVNMNVTARYVPDTPAVDVRATQVILCNVIFLKTDINSNTSFLNTYQLKIRMGADGTFSINTDTETDPAYLNTDYLGTLSGSVIFQSGAVTLNETETVKVVVSYFHSPHVANGALNSNGLGSGIGGIWSNSELFIDASNNLYDGTYYLKVKANSIFYNEIANANYVEGLPINMNNAVLQKVKQKDFLMSIIKMFNLYLEQDKDDPQKFIIEPRDDGYYLPATAAANIIDLSDKLDISQPLNIRPMGALDVKTYRFKYKEDKDYFNTEYLNKWGETYSEREIDITNDFLVNEKTTDVIFSPTPSVGSLSNDRVIPRIVNIDLNGTVSPVAANPRILIWSGLKDTSFPWNIIDSTGLNDYTQYPYAGMLDDPFDPTVSLDWEVPDEIYWTNIYNTITYTNKNLYNQYWKKFINEVTDRNSKIVTGYFNITPRDYANLDFRKVYYFEREYFRLNKVIDYNPLNDALTQLEFIKIQEGVTTSFQLTEADDVHQVDRTPRFSEPIDRGGNLRRSGEYSPISGYNNRVADSVGGFSIAGDNNMIGEWADNIIINGDDNDIASYSSGVTVIGDGNRVSGSNVSLINCFNQTVTLGNVTMINNRAVSGDGSVVLITTGKTIGTDGNDVATLYLCDCTSGAITFTLPPAADYGIGNWLSIKKIDSTGNAITITPDGSETIDGAATLVVNVQWDAPKLTSDGLNWYIT